MRHYYTALINNRIMDMPIPTTNLSGEFQFDLENKLFLPSKQLYGALETKISALYQAIREILIEFHNTIAVYAQQLYEYPTETMTAWYGQTASKSIELSTTINNEIIPELNMFYESNMQKMQATNQEWSGYIRASAIKTSDFCVAFYENPLEMSEKTYDYFLEAVGQLSTMGGEWVQQFKVAVIAIYQSSLAALDLFFDAPLATAEAMYYQAVSGILNLYYALVANALEMLSNTVPTLV